MKIYQIEFSEVNFGLLILTCKTISCHFQWHIITNILSLSGSVIYDPKILSTRMTIDKRNDHLKCLN